MSDLRVEKTKENIRETVLGIFMEKNIGDISISEVASQARISRKTFYSHYDSVHDVMTEIEEAILKNLEGIFYRNDFITDSSSVGDLFVSLNREIENNIDFYRRLVVTDFYHVFVYDMKELFRRIIAAKGKGGNEKKMGLYAEYLSGGVIAAYFSWFEGRIDLPLDDLSRHTSDIFWKGAEKLAEILER